MVKLCSPWPYATKAPNRHIPPDFTMLLRYIRLAIVYKHDREYFEISSPLLRGVSTFYPGIRMLDSIPIKSVLTREMQRLLSATWKPTPMRADE